MRLHWPPALRPAFDALFGIDDALADVVLKAREPQLAAIKLAWWREQLQALDSSSAAAEPRLEDAARELLPRAIAGADLARLEDGWLTLLQAEPDRAVAAERGAILYDLAQRLLGGFDPRIGDEGRIWARADVARRTGSAEWLDETLPAGMSVPRKLRPLTLLAALARRDHRAGFPPEPEATPGRAWTLLRHRLTGRL